MSPARPRGACGMTGSGSLLSCCLLFFDLFVQGERTLDRSQGGLGIGLTLVRRLVELHNGTVSVDSEGANCGSLFTVRLPAVQAVGVCGCAEDRPRPRGYGTPDALERSRRAGFDHHLIKPVNPESLYRLLSTYEDPASAGVAAPAGRLYNGRLNWCGVEQSGSSSGS